MDIIPALASILGELRRNPGKNDGWIEAVLQSLERDHPDGYERIRKRLGFARRLAHFAHLPEYEEAALTMGLLFYQLLADRSHGEPPKVSRPWADYLLANEESLGPAYALAEVIQLAEWEDVTSMTAVIAKVAVAFDGAIERRSRPLQVLQSLRESAQTVSLERVIELLWSEEGQELCDQHIRRRGQGYRIGANEIRQSLETLRSGRALVEPKPERSYLRLLTPNRDEREPDGGDRDLEAAAATASFENFEKRRQALRAGAPEHDEIEHPAPVDVMRNVEREPAVAKRAPVEEPPAVAPAKDVTPPEARPIDRPSKQRQEEAMVTRNTAGTSANGAGQDLVGRLHEMRSWFDDLRRMATDGQAIFTDMAPQMEEFASRVSELEEVASRIAELEEFANRIAELEAMVDRWKGLRGTVTKAA